MFGPMMTFALPQAIDAGDLTAHAHVAELQQRIVKILAMHDIDILVAGRTLQPLAGEAGAQWWFDQCQMLREAYEDA